MRISGGAGKIRISGERQTGKTEMVIDTVTRQAQEGRRVAYVSHTLKCAAEVQRRIEDRGGYERSYRTNGQQRVTYPSGGSIRFISSGHNSGRGLMLDTLVWDDVQKPIPEDVLCALVPSPEPRIYEVVTDG